MGDETVLADLDPIGEAALDHVPAEQTLCEAERQNTAQRRAEPPRQLTTQPKPHERRGKGDPDQPAQ